MGLAAFWASRRTGSELESRNVRGPQKTSACPQVCSRCFRRLFGQLAVEPGWPCHWHLMCGSSDCSGHGAEAPTVLAAASGAPQAQQMWARCLGGRSAHTRCRSVLIFVLGCRPRGLRSGCRAPTEQLRAAGGLQNHHQPVSGQAVLEELEGGQCAPHATAIPNPGRDFRTPALHRVARFQSVRTCSPRPLVKRGRSVRGPSAEVGVDCAVSQAARESVGSGGNRLGPAASLGA